VLAWLHCLAADLEIVHTLVWPSLTVQWLPVRLTLPILGTLYYVHEPESTLPNILWQAAQLGASRAMLCHKYHSQHCRVVVWPCACLAPCAGISVCTHGVSRRASSRMMTPTSAYSSAYWEHTQVELHGTTSSLQVGRRQHCRAATLA
jgi:hypothetical protein